MRFWLVMAGFVGAAGAVTAWTALTGCSGTDCKAADCEYTHVNATFFNEAGCVPKDLDDDDSDCELVGATAVTYTVLPFDEDGVLVTLEEGEELDVKDAICGARISEDTAEDEGCSLWVAYGVFGQYTITAKMAEGGKLEGTIEVKEPNAATACCGKVAIEDLYFPEAGSTEGGDDTGDDTGA